MSILRHILEIADRSLMDIDDHAIFGYGVKVSSHVISPSREHGGLKVYVRVVKVEKGGFVGAAARIAPGVHVKGALVKATTDVYPDTVVEPQSETSSQMAFFQIATWPLRWRFERSCQSPKRRRLRVLKRLAANTSLTDYGKHFGVVDVESFRTTTHC